MSKAYVSLRNWWCARCRAWIASCDMYEDRTCRVCGKKCEWREFKPEIFQEEVSDGEH